MSGQESLSSLSPLPTHPSQQQHTAVIRQLNFELERRQNRLSVPHWFEEVLCAESTRKSNLCLSVCDLMCGDSEVGKKQEGVPDSLPPCNSWTARPKMEVCSHLILLVGFWRTASNLLSLAEATAFSCLDGGWHCGSHGYRVPPMTDVILFASVMLRVQVTEAQI